MKIQSIGARALLALTSAFLFAPTTSEAALTFNTNGDVFLGFHATGGEGSGASYLVNLGSISQFLNATDSITLSLGNIKADLDTNFAGWENRADFLWGVTGTQTSAGNTLAARSIFASKPQLSGAALGTSDSTPWNRASTATQNAVVQRINPMESAYGALSATSNSPVAAFEPVGTTNSYHSFQLGGANTTATTAFQYFNSGIEDSFGGGTSGAVLDFYVLQPDSAGSAGDFIGNFSISNSGTVTFTPEGVPEPATATVVAAGALVLTLVRRRRMLGC